MVYRNPNRFYVNEVFINFDRPLTGPRACDTSHHWAITPAMSLFPSQAGYRNRARVIGEKICDLSHPFGGPFSEGLPFRGFYSG